MVLFLVLMSGTPPASSDLSHVITNESCALFLHDTMWPNLLRSTSSQPTFAHLELETDLLAYCTPLETFITIINSSRTATIIMSTNIEPTLNSPSRLNTKQRLRIQKRRAARQKLQELFALKQKDAKRSGQQLTYPNAPHLSAGCMRHLRGPDGRFLTPEQIATQELERLAITEGKIEPAGVDSLTNSGREKPKL
jgi:hypothetical protein